MKSRFSFTFIQLYVHDAMASNLWNSVYIINTSRIFAVYKDSKVDILYFMTNCVVGSSLVNKASYALNTNCFPSLLLILGKRPGWVSLVAV